MNAPVPHRAILRHHVATVESRHPLKILGLLPAGSVGHVRDASALEFLAERCEGLSYFGLAAAERDLSDLTGRPVGIVLRTGLRGSEAEDFPRLAEPV